MNKLYLILVLFSVFFLESQCQISENIDKYVMPLVSNKDFSGVVCVTENNSIVHFKSYGSANLEWDQPNTKNTIFHIASLTKQFTAAAILIAEQNKLLSTEDFVSEFISDFPNGEKIKIKYLLSQRSGIVDYNDLGGYSDISIKESSLDEVIDWFKNEPLQFEPNNKYSYSNSNFILAAKILEVVSGESYSNFLQKYIFDPLDMMQTGNYSFEEIVPFRATGYEPAPNGLVRASYYNKSYKMGSGSLYSSAIDLLKWDKALNENHILTSESKEKIFTDYGDNYGFGWGVYQNKDVGKFVSHDGKSPGYFAYMKRYFERTPKILIIILSNINSGVMNSMKSDITNIVFNKEFPIYESYEIQPTPKNLNPYLGKYNFPPDYNFTIVEKDSELFFQWMDTPFLQYLTHVGKDRFLMRSRYDYLYFTRDEKGLITSIKYLQKADTTNCMRIKNSTDKN